MGRLSLARLARFDALALTALIWFLAKFLRYAFPPLFGRIQDLYGVSNTVVGTAFAGLLLVYALMQFPSGVLADRVGAVRVITGGALVAAGAALSLVLAGPFAALVVGMLLVGLGTGAHKTVAVRLLSRAYPARTGRALGVLDTVGAFGGVVAPAVVVALTTGAATGLGWRTLFLGGGLCGVLLAVGFARRVPRRLPDANAHDREAVDWGLGQYFSLFASRRLSLFVAVTVLSSFAYNGAVAFLPLYLTDAAGLTAAFAGTVYSGLFVVSLVQPLTGDLSDRVGQLVVIGATLALAAVGLVAALVASAPLALAASVLVFGLGSHGYRPVRGAYLVRVIPEDVAGGTLGVVRTMIMGVGAVSPAVVGFLADRTGFGAAFGLLAASLALSVVFVGVLALTSDGPSEPSDARSAP